MINSKKSLVIKLSKLLTFDSPKIKLEQYSTSADIVGDWVWWMYMNNEIDDKIILDAGCGTGIIGLALLLLGAKKVYFLDVDEKAIELCKQNYNNLNEEYELGKAEFLVQDVSLFDKKVDIVVQNPPFGTKDEHADKKFLEKAFTLAHLVYSMHKITTKVFVEAIAKDYKFKIAQLLSYDFPIKAQFEHHKMKIKNIEVGVWKLTSLQEN
jgi:putative methylase